MNSSLLLSVVTFVYGFSAVLYIIAWIFKKPIFGKGGTWSAALAVAGNIIGLILRWQESYQLGIGHAPLSNLYESLVFFSATIATIYLFAEIRYKNRIMGAFIMPFAFLAIAYASLNPDVNDRIMPLLPALKSNWLIAHVITCFIGYGGFTVSIGMSLMYILKKWNPSVLEYFLAKFPQTSHLDEVNHQMVKFGFLFLTVGIITGAVWANSAWGRYWGWDPKETWSLITWLIYAAMLHFRYMLAWRGTRFAVFSVIGFMAMLFTYFGVNLLPGLHSYGAK